MIKVCFLALRLATGEFSFPLCPMGHNLENGDNSETALSLTHTENSGSLVGMV